MNCMTKSKKSEHIVRRGDVYFADLGNGVGSEQGGIRPVLVVQNDLGNRHSPTIIVAPMTSRQNKTELPTHCPVVISKRPSLVLLEQLRVIDKSRLMGTRVCKMEDMSMIDKAIGISVGLSKIEKPVCS